MEQRQSRSTIAGAVVALGLFFVFAGDGLRGYFAPDEMMNLYQAWFPPLSELLHHDRPLGALLYRGLFAAFGLHALPYRIFCLLVVLANLGLLYRFCRLASDSGEVAFLALAMGVYHPHLADLYYTSSNLFDLVCFTFYFAALTCYMAIRQKGEWPNARQTATLLMLYGGALASKEMAVTLPVMVVIYEAIFHSPWWKNAGRLWFVWLAAPITVWYAARKITGASAMTLNPEYRLHVSLHSFLAAWRHYLTDLFYRTIPFPDAMVVGLWVALLVLAAITRRRDLQLAWSVMMVGALPFVFIVPRGFFVMYLTLPGWYLYGGRVAVMLRDLVRREIPRAAGALGVRAEQLALAGAVVLVAIFLNAREKPAGNDWLPGAFAQTRPVVEQLSMRYPAMPHGAKLLFLSDPCPPHDYLLYFTVALVYRDKDIRVDRVKDDAAFAAGAAHYDHVFEWTAAGLQER